MRLSIIHYLLFATLSILIFRPLLGNVWYPVHDTSVVARAYLLEHTLFSGQIPALWSAELNGGQGYPLFHFYAPLMTYLSLLVKTITGSYFVGIKLVLILFSVLSALGMYLLTHSLLSATAYLLLPYAAVNLYVRGAYAEYLAMALLPWVFYVWQNLSTLRRQLTAALITTLFLLSHNLIPLITFPFLIVWVLLHHRLRLKILILPLILTLALSAFYLLPLLFERSFVQADTVAKTTDYTLHFVSPSQLWNSTWGYGGSTQGLEDGLSFKIGKLHLLLALVGTWALVKQKSRLGLFFLVSASFSILMTTSYSAFIWQSIPLLPMVQFPWRFLALISFFVSVLAGYSLTLIKNKLLNNLSLLTILGALLFLNLKYFTPQTTFAPELSAYTTDSYLATIPLIVPEYTPSWVSHQNPSVPDSTILPYLYYPTWEVKLNSQVVKTYPSIDGHLAFYNPTHSSNFTLRQSHTLLENLASTISLITALTLLFYYLFLKNYVKT